MTIPTAQTTALPLPPTIMKTILTALLLTLVAAAPVSAEAKPAVLTVLTALDAAKTKSRQTGKPVFLEFMSSTCPRCHAFEKTVLSDPAFITYANENLIVVIHDYQALSSLPASEMEKRKELMVEFKVEGFPTILLIDQSGKTLMRTAGYGGTKATKFIESLKTAITAGATPGD